MDGEPAACRAPQQGSAWEELPLLHFSSLLLHFIAQCMGAAGELLSLE